MLERSSTSLSFLLFLLPILFSFSFSLFPFLLYSPSEVLFFSSSRTFHISLLHSVSPPTFPPTVFFFYLSFLLLLNSLSFFLQYLCSVVPCCTSGVCECLLVAVSEAVTRSCFFLSVADDDDNEDDNYLRRCNDENKFLHSFPGFPMFGHNQGGFGGGSIFGNDFFADPFGQGGYV